MGLELELREASVAAGVAPLPVAGMLSGANKASAAKTNWDILPVTFTVTACTLPDESGRYPEYRPCGANLDHVKRSVRSQHHERMFRCLLRRIAEHASYVCNDRFDLDIAEDVFPGGHGCLR